MTKQILIFMCIVLVFDNYGWSCVSGTCTSHNITCGGYTDKTDTCVFEPAYSQCVGDCPLYAGEGNGTFVTCPGYYGSCRFRSGNDCVFYVEVWVCDQYSHGCACREGELAEVTIPGKVCY